MLENLNKFLLGLILAGLLLFAAANCDKPLFRNDLEAIQARGVLKVITRNNGTCFYEGPHGHEGFEYDLVQAFADYLNLELELVIIDSETVMVTELLKGNADLIAANFIVKEDLRRHLAFGPVIQEMQQLVIGRPGGPALRTVTDLIGQPIWVRAGAFQEKRLNTLKKEYPNLTWLSVSDYESEELLEMVWQGIIPLTIADSQTIAINRKYYPELAIHFAIDESQKLGWVMDPQNIQLRETVNEWFTLPSTVSLLERLKQHYYGHLDSFDYMDIKIFRKRLFKRLPRYRKHFEAAALKNGLDWKLIAAQAYQESHWNPRAKSFTGVRGVDDADEKNSTGYGCKKPARSRTVDLWRSPVSGHFI